VIEEEDPAARPPPGVHLIENRIGAVVRLALTIPLADVEAALAARRQAAAGPVIDPTRLVRDGRRWTLAVLEAGAACRRVLEERRAR
jgi:hypothetical protein